MGQWPKSTRSQNRRAPARPGQHKVFLGMAAGVGKTYRMLQEAQAEAEGGRDVVIGYLEPHRRPETAAQATGLEVIPRRRVVYRDVALEEMDLPTVLNRRPELCLIDELAHTNAPGVEHGKRYEDVRDVLAAGIDVYSTVNVQHLESLNDRMTELTGTRVRETLPDGVLGEADEVVLIDLTPEALIDRLRAGKVYPGERIESALNNFFKIENLAALREVALRQVAEEVEAKRLVFETVPSRGDDSEMIESAAPQAVGERLLALVKPTPKSQRVVRRAWRSAQRLQAELDILWVSSRRARRGGARATCGAAAAGHRTRGAPAGRARRRRRRDGPPRRRRARHDLRTDGDAAAARRAAAPDRACAAVPSAAEAPRHRPPHRRRPQPPQSRGAAVTHFLVITIAVLGLGLAVLGGLYVRDRRRGARTLTPSARRILFPFAGRALSRRALDAALRLARVDGATLVPVFLARVPMNMPLDAPLPRQCSEGMPLLETIEQRAIAAGVPVDARIEPGRTYRHALREAITHERYDRLVVAAASARSEGFNGEDVAWLLDHAPGEVIIIRPDRDDRLNGRDRMPERRTPRSDEQDAAPLMAWPDPMTPSDASVRSGQTAGKIVSASQGN